MYAHSSETEQNSEITMTPALYCCPTQTWQHVLSAYGLNISHNITAIYTVQRYRAGVIHAIYHFCVVHQYRAGVVVISEVCSVLLLCAYTIESCLWTFVTILIQRILSLHVYSLFSIATAIMHLYEHGCAQKSRQVSRLECMCAY